jgi:hypothetical protein
MLALSATWGFARLQAACNSIPARNAETIVFCVVIGID